MSKPDTKSPTVDVGTLARLFNLTAVRVQQLAKDGIITKAERGRYDLWASIRGYIKFLQERRVNQWDNGEDESSPEYSKERALLTKARREAAQINTDVLKSRIHEGEAVRTLWVDMMMNCRAKLLSLPTKAAPMIADKDRIAEAQALLEELVNEALSELADYNPQRIAERTDLKRLNMPVVPGDSDPLVAAPEADDQ
jgi:phage terminase Nu1 subunit (DNA packaging protein)